MKNWLCRWLAVATLAFFGGLASASPLINLDLVPSKQKVFGGEVFYVNVVISGLRTAGLNAAVAAFDLEVSFSGWDVSALSGPPTAFGSALGDPGLAEAITFADFSDPNVLRIAETSLLDAGTLTDLQSDSFILATLGFQVASEPLGGPASFFISQFDIADAFGRPITDDAGNPVPIQTSPVNVSLPVPPTLYLTLAALLGAMLSTSRSRKRRAIAMAGILALPIGLATSAHGAELSATKAAQTTFAGASAWAVREDRNYSAYAKALVLNTLWDTSPSLRANPAGMAAAVQQKWNEDQTRDDPIGRKLERALNAGARSLGKEAGPLAEKLQEKVVAPVMPVVDEALLDKGGRALKGKRGYVSPVDASLALEDEFQKVAQRSTDPRFVQAYNQTVGASLGVRMGLSEAATRAQRPTYQAALEANADVRAMRNAKGGFSIGAAQAVNAIKTQMGGVAQIAAGVKSEVSSLAPLQGNVVGYMGDTALRAAQRATLQQAAQVQQGKLDGARAATHLLGTALAADNPKLAQQVGVLKRSHHRVAESYIGYERTVADLGKAPNLPPASARMAATVLTGNLLGASAELFSLYGNAQSPDASIVGHVRSLGKEIRDLPAGLSQHNGRMDVALAGINRDLGTELAKLELATADIQQKVGEIQSHLYAIEDKISSLERNLTTIMQEATLQAFLVDQDTALGYKARTNLTMALSTFDAYQVLFRSWADQVPCNTIFSAPAAAGYTSAGLYEQLVRRGYTTDENFDFLVKYADAALGRAGVTEGCAGSGRLPNPNVWLLGANAYVQLARENPWYAARTERNNPQALSSVIATGTVLKQALQSLGSADPSTGRRDIVFQAIDGYGSRSGQLFAAMAGAAPGTSFTSLVEPVSGHLALLKALMSVGLPRSLAENDYLDSMIAGDQALPSGEDIVRLYAEGAVLSTLQATVDARRTALRAELVEVFQAIDRADYAQLHSAVEAMLAELENRRSVSSALAVGDFYSARTGAPLIVPAGAVLANDAHPFPADTVTNAVKARLWVGPAQGTLTWPRTNDGSFTYQPATGFTGLVSFTYKASDGVFDSQEATVTIRVGDYGDLNGDGVVDSQDLALLMGLIGKDIDAATLDKADLNADGVVNALDARALVWICAKPNCAR